MLNGGSRSFRFTGEIEIQKVASVEIEYIELFITM